MGKDLLGRIRSPSDEEKEFFKRRPEVAGYAADDDAVVLNPQQSGINTPAVIQNERARILMRRKKVRAPRFELTPEQSKAFKAYSPHEADRKATVAARLLTGDASAGAATPEQTKYVTWELGRVMKRRFKEYGE